MRRVWWRTGNNRRRLFSGTSTSVALHDAKITPQMSPAVRMNLYVCRFIINSQIHRRRVRFVRGERFARDAVLTFDPSSEIGRACTARNRRDETSLFFQSTGLPQAGHFIAQIAAQAVKVPGTLIKAQPAV